jgi:hypothetical protein
MTNWEAWIELCGALGEDPDGLRQTSLSMLLDSERSGCVADPGLQVWQWIHRALDWQAQPQGYAWWATLKSDVFAAAPHLRVGPGRMRQAIRLARASRL